MKKRKTFPLFSTTLCLVTLLGCSDPTATPSWVSAGVLVQARREHAATPLSNGAVLFSGGMNGSTILASAELRDTATGRWSLTEPMQEPRMQHAGVRIFDGSILLLGGKNDTASSSVDRFDSATRQFARLAPMTNARFGHTATSVHVKTTDPTTMTTVIDWGVVVAGGRGLSDTLASVELYDPQTNAWSVAMDMSFARMAHTATVIDDQWVLVVGGTDGMQVHASAELYDAATRVWTDAGSLQEARHNHTSTLLPDGSILVVGGQNEMNGALSSAERYHCERDQPTAAVKCTVELAGLLNHARHGHTATLLHDGQVLVVGGEDANGSLDSVEMYEVEERKFVEAEPLSSARVDHSATWLADGSVLIAGGKATTDLATTERFVPNDPRIPCERTTDCPRALVCNIDEKRCEQEPGPLSSEAACTYGGDGARTGAGVIGAFAILLGAWSMRRKRVSKRMVTSVVAGTILFVPGLSRAQTPTFYLDRLQMAGGSEDGTGVWRPVFGRTGLFGQVAFGYARDPLRVASFVHNTAPAQALVGSAVSLQVTGYATVGVELLKRGAIQVSVPYFVHQRGYATDNRAVGLNQPVALVPSALGDVRIDGRMLVASNEAQSFALALRGAVFLPTGDEFSFAGERSAWGNLGLSAEYKTEAFFLTANLGLTVRPRSSLEDLTVGSEFVYAIGAYVPLMAMRIRLGAELFGGLGLASTSSRDTQAIPVEAALTSRVALGAQRRVFLGLSVGGRVGPGYAPDMRFVVRIGGVVPFEKVQREPSLPVRVSVAVDVDTDQDGFVDADDGCPVVKEDFKREKDGCPETDEDRDGIDTVVDGCPAKPEDKDGIDDTDGCPEDDADGDGFADIDDKCPKEPGVRNADPAKLGCPQFIERTKTEVKLFKQIDFDYNSATIALVSFPILDEIARLLVANPDIAQLRIEGHTDNVGDASFNQSLSQRRAEAVRNYLVQRWKVKPGRVLFAGFGQTKPLAPNDTPEGRAKNRRVELYIGNAAGTEEKKR